jgi:hypothetical protein
MKALSIVLLFLGFLLIAAGWLFKIMHWPGSLPGFYAGAAMVISGLALLIISLKRESGK